MGYYLTTTAESVAIIEEVGSPMVKVLYDVYHQQITEGNLINNIRANIRHIGHIHVGDVPGASSREPARSTTRTSLRRSATPATPDLSSLSAA
jgi:hydroxypyruvate isomerase